MTNFITIEELPQILSKVREKATIESFDKSNRKWHCSVLKQNLWLAYNDLELCLRLSMWKTKQQNFWVENKAFNNVEPTESFYVDADLYLYDYYNNHTIFFKWHFNKTYYWYELESYKKSFLLKDIKWMKEYLKSITSKLNIFA